MFRLAIVWGVFALIGTGCASSPILFTARLADVENRDYYAVCETFKPGETPAMVVSGQSGHDVTVQLRKCDMDMVIQKKSFHIKRQELKWVYWKSLPSGDYIAELIVRGETNAVAAFVMEAEAAKDQ
ncbi:MAG: hypothetical protein HN919_04365 [Verrucomicrobia bacterium]|nr:hypothetical protein [Verrucomicrobiota bacterium]